MKKVFIATLAFMALSTYSVSAQTSEINQRIKMKEAYCSSDSRIWNHLTKSHLKHGMMKNIRLMLSTSPL